MGQCVALPEAVTREHARVSDQAIAIELAVACHRIDSVSAPQLELALDDASRRTHNGLPAPAIRRRPVLRRAQEVRDDVSTCVLRACRAHPLRSLPGGTTEYAGRKRGKQQKTKPSKS
jgi:hypothetical protein